MKLKLTAVKGNDHLIVMLSGRYCAVNVGDIIDVADRDGHRILADHFDSFKIVWGDNKAIMDYQNKSLADSKELADKALEEL